MQRFTKVPIWLVAGVVWAFVGLIVALGKDYGEMDSGSDAWTLAFAVITWPIVLAGGDVSIRF